MTRFRPSVKVQREMREADRGEPSLVQRVLDHQRDGFAPDSIAYILGITRAAVDNILAGKR